MVVQRVKTTQTCSNMILTWFVNRRLVMRFTVLQTSGISPDTAIGKPTDQYLYRWFKAAFRNESTGFQGVPGWGYRLGMA